MTNLETAIIELISDDDELVKYINKFSIKDIKDIMYIYGFNLEFILTLLCIKNSCLNSHLYYIEKNFFTIKHYINSCDLCTIYVHMQEDKDELWLKETIIRVNKDIELVLEVENDEE